MQKSVADLPTFPSKPTSGLFHLLTSKDSKQVFKNVLDLDFKMDETFKLWASPFLIVVVQEKDDLKAVFQSVSKPLFYRFGPEVLRDSLGIMTDGV